MFKKWCFTASVFLLVLFTGNCSKGPKIEQIKVDTAKTLTQTNVYGQPDIVFSNNGYPVFEYIWNGAFIDKLVANFYFKNIGNTGKCEFIVSIAEEKKRTLNLQANTFYILRIVVTQFGPTGPWNSERWIQYPISLKVKDMTDLITFKAPQAYKSETDKFKLLDFKILLEKMYDAGEKDLSNLPDKKWFNNTIWKDKYKYGIKIDRYLKLRDDGLLGYNDKKPDNFVFDGNDTWEIKDGYLILNWNGGFAFVKYELTNKDTNYLFGTHSNSSVLYMLHRIKKLGDW